MSLRIAVLASGSGTNLQALIESRARIPIEIVVVASDKSHAPALRRAEKAGIETLALDPQRYTTRAGFDADLFARIEAYTPGLIVLAGFMRILDPRVLEPWAGRIINIHPSLLPKYRGLHTHRRALDAGDDVHGASVHYVTADLDDGPTMAQVEVPVERGDSTESLAARVLVREHRLLVASVGLVAAGRIKLDEAGVVLDGKVLCAPLHLLADDTLATR